MLSFLVYVYERGRRDQFLQVAASAQPPSRVAHEVILDGFLGADLLGGGDTLGPLLLGASLSLSDSLTQ